MSELEALVLGIVQGIAEFLPISSSGHLVLTRWLFGWDDPGVAFDVAVHVGTLGALLVVFRHRWLALARGLLPSSDAAERRLARRRLVLIAIGTVPIAVVGLAIRDSLDDTLRNPTWVGAFLLGTAAALLAGERLGHRLGTMDALSERTAFGIGLAQSIAVLPGVSRSGLAIVGGLLGNLTREDATDFAFYLATPAIAGAGIVLGYDLISDGGGPGQDAGTIAIGVAASFVTALIAIRALISLVQSRSFAPFIGYCLLAGVAVLLARAAGA